MTDDIQNYTFLRKGGIEQRMNCTASVAYNIEQAFVTVEQLLKAVESDTDLTDIDGIGPKTAEAILDWYENRESREIQASDSTVERTSSSSMNITFHQSWEDALGIEIGDGDTPDARTDGGSKLPFADRTTACDDCQVDESNAIETMEAVILGEQDPDDRWCSEHINEFEEETREWSGRR